MKIKEIIKVVEEFAPKTLAAEWDHVGLMIGSVENECSGIICALDLTMEVAEKAKKEKCNFILTHHPFFFNPVDNINFDETNGQLIAYIIKNDITVYSAHTNMDIANGGISYTLATLLGGKKLVQQGYGYLFDVEKTTLLDLAKLVKSILHDPTVKFVGKDNKKISKVYVVSGAGFDSEEYALAKNTADCFITGDIKYHNQLNAYEDKYPIIEYSHYYSEIIVEEIFVSLLKKLNIKVIKSNEKCPFKMVED